MDALGHSVTFPVNEMLLTDEGAASDSVVVNEMGGGGQPSFVFSSEGGTATLLSLPFALLHDSGLATLPTSATAGASTAAQPIGGTNTTNIIIKQSTSSAQPGLPTNTIFLDAAQMALLSSGEGQVVLTDAFLEEGQQGSEAQQIFFQVTSDALHEEDETAGQKEDGAMVQQPGMPLHDIRGRGQSIVIPERRPVLPKAKRGPGRPRRDDSKIMPPSVKGVWFCQSCGKEFSKWPLLKKHMKTHSDDKPHRCSHCPASFNVPWNLKLHESTHVSPTSSSGGPLRCPACTRTFSRIASLKAHVMLHEEDESLFCTQCGEEFSTQGALDDHLRIHEVEAHNIDPLADETAPTVGLENAVWLPDGSAHFSDAVHSFVSADQQVVSGMLTDSPRAGHRCRLCNAIFRKAGQLREHMKEHSKVKASLLRRNHKRNIDRSSFLHKCKNCSKGFQKPSQLVRHMRIHTGERPYKCSTCDRAFNQKGSLQIHMTKHSGVKPFTCEFCSAGFRQRGNLRAHILRVHTIPVTGEQAFRCCECPCVFRKLGSLNAHVSRVHGHSTSSGNGLSRKRKRADGSTVGDSLDDDVSDVLKDLAELEEATRGLGGGVGSADGRAQEAVRRGMVGEGLKDAVGEGPHPSDILQQALEKSGLSGKKAGVVSESPHQEADLVQKKATVAERTEEDGSMPLDAIIATDSNHSTSHSCVLTLADKAHDGTVRRYSIKVRRLGGVRWHQCTYCPKEFKKPSDLVRHIRIHTHEKPYKCNMCFRAFAVKSTLTVHLRIHSGLKSYECLTCKKKFASQSSLKVHQRLHSGLKPFSCPYCSLRFRTTGHRKTHISSHFRVRFRTSKKQRQRMEEQAAKEDIRRVYLQDPIVVQQPQQEIPANTQEGSDDPSPVVQEGEPVAAVGGEVAVPVPDPSVPQDEMRVVIMDNRPHGCEHCPAAFKKFAHLKQHLRSHTGEKPFGCTTCNKAFVSKSVLKTHLKTHVPFMAPSRRPYSCSECGRKFVASSSLKRHMINAHENLRKKLLKETFLCPYCSCPPFNSSRACRKHILTHTGELLEALEREVEQERAQATAQPEGGNVQQVGDVVPPPRPILVLDGSQRVANMRLENGRIPEGTQLAVVPKGQENEPIDKEAASEPVMEECETDNVVVTFSLDFPATDGLGGQVINHQVSMDGQEDDGGGTQTVATISLADTDGLSQDSLRQIEQSLSTGMFGEAIEAGAGTSSTTVEHHDAQEAIKDTGTAALDLHAISFDPSVFSNITLPPGESLNLHASLQPMEEDGIANPVPEPAPDTADRLEEGDDKDDDLRGRRKKVHKCTFCHRIFKKCSHLKQHLRTHTGEKPFQCLVCMRMFVTMGTLKAHFRTHTGEKSFACETCGAHFTTNGSLRRHMIAHSNEGRIFQCERCQQGFRTVGNWRRHWRSHEKELIGSRGPGTTERSEEGEVRPAEGVVAELESVAEEAGTGVAGVVEEGMKEGQEVVEAPTQEEVASMPNPAPVNFKRIGLKRRSGTSSGAGAAAGISGGVIRLSEEETTRLAMQSPSQPHLTLSERVLIASAAERERISEINDKQRQLQLAPKLPHVCPHCPKSFRKPSDLARHVRTHTGERPFACDKCGRRFTVKSTLDSHRMTHPLEDGDGSLLCHPKYPCHVCGCLFATKGSLKVHMRLHTGARPFKCPQCEQRFRTSGHRKAHLLTHVRSQQALGAGVVGGGARDGAGRRGRGRRAKTMALEAMRTIDEALRDAAADCAQEEANATNTTAGGDEEEVGGGVVDWATTLHANLTAGGEEGTGVSGAGGKAAFVHLGQLEDGLILGQVPQHHLDDDQDASARGGASIAGQRLPNVGAIDAVATGVEGVVESLSFEAGDEVGGLFGGQSLEVILENKSQHFRGGKAMSSKGEVGEEAAWGAESNVRGRSLGVLDEEGNISLVIDGDFVIEEDGTLRQVVGGECVVLSGLGRCDDGNSEQVIDDGQQ